MQVVAWGRLRPQKAAVAKPPPRVSSSPAVHHSHLTVHQAKDMLERAKKKAAQNPSPIANVPVVYSNLEEFVKLYGNSRSPLQTAGDYLDANKKWHFTALRKLIHRGLRAMWSYFIRQHTDDDWADIFSIINLSQKCVDLLGYIIPDLDQSYLSASQRYFFHTCHKQFGSSAIPISLSSGLILSMRMDNIQNLHICSGWIL